MRAMKGVVGVLAVGGAVLLGAIGQAQALTVTHAQLSGDIVAVLGSGAAAAASIKWEGVVVTASSARGNFGFATTSVPADCIGTVSDGVSTVNVPIEGCGVASAALLATGQTMCWIFPGTEVPCAGTGQDGEFRAGIPQRYATQAQTITDLNTGLVWEKKTAANVQDGYFWGDAFEYVESLNAVNFGGHNDWRLPNVRELQSLIDYGRFDPAVAPEFNDCANGSCTVSSTYWSSTSAQSAGNLAWRVSFFDGAHLVGGKNFTIRVRAVRGGL